MLKSIIRSILKAIVLFSVGFVVYEFIELAFRGYTYTAMGIAGGCIFLVIGAANNVIPWEMPLIQQGIIGSIIITTFELVCGTIVNYYGLPKMWDYSNILLNYKGVICLPFSLAWIGLAIVAVWLDDFLRWELFKEEKPHYVWF